jgi:hypothetical protein
MNRRELFKKVLAPFAAAGIAVEAQAVEKEPLPLCLALKVDRRLSNAAKERLQRSLEAAFKGMPPVPVLILDAGMDVIAVPGRIGGREA